MVAGMENVARDKFGEAQAASEDLEIVLRSEPKVTGILQQGKGNTRDVQYAHHD
jgi:hypothetical protein